MTSAPRRTRWRRAQPSSAPSEPREFELPQQGWEQRTITLLHDRAETDRICRGWEEVGWCVLAIDDASGGRAGHPAHVVRLAVPPPDWLATSAGPSAAVGQQASGQQDPA